MWSWYRFTQAYEDQSRYVVCGSNSDPLSSESELDTLQLRSLMRSTIYTNRTNMRHLLPFSHSQNHSETSPREDSKRTHNYMQTVTVTFLNPALSLPLCIRLAMTSSDASATVLVVGILLNHTNFTLVPNHTKLWSVAQCTSPTRFWTEAELLTFSSLYTSSTFLPSVFNLRTIYPLAG